jgi:hypothetical protein
VDCVVSVLARPFLPARRPASIEKKRLLFDYTVKSRSRQDTRFVERGQRFDGCFSTPEAGHRKDRKTEAETPPEILLT